MAKALGARLVEPRSFDHLRSIFDALQADDRYYTHAGIRFQDGAWRTISDGLPSPLASKLLPPAPDSPRVFTSAMPKNIMSIAGNMKMPMTCLEYPDVKSFESRPRPPLEDEFEIDGRHFGLLKFVLTGYMVQAFLDFAGYQSPIIHDKELLAKVQEHLKDFDEKIALGLQMFGVAWCWRDRSPLAEGVKVDLTSLDKQFLANKNYSVVVIQNGQLQANFYCDAILVEL
jgi:hypothetical protein